MLTVREAIQKRRSTRSFKPTPVPDEMILEMLEAARLAPSASNNQPWRFVVVTDAEEKKALRKICFNQSFIEDAGVDFVFCADPSSYSVESRRRRIQEAVDSGLISEGNLSDSTLQRYQEMAANEPDLPSLLTPLTANTYIAVEHMVLMATGLGLGSCWVGGISSYKDIRDMLQIPRGILVLGVLAVGYTNIEPKARPHHPLEKIMLRPFPA
ncbi:MAG TPA: oxidoreductase [Dehalococcoidia bacterium]|nr:oxidoreductase [Dehalococcoidia bacterium]